MKMKKQPETNDLLNYDEAVNFLEHTFDHKGRTQFSVNQRTAIKTVISESVYLKEEINILKLEIANNKLKNELLTPTKPRTYYCSNGMFAIEK